jgi:hypothetical protein
MKKTITLLSILLICIASYAQTEIPGPNEDLTKSIIAGRINIIKETPFIFEGTVIKTVGFIGKDKDFYTSNIVQITKILRGHNNLKLGTIEVITHGGDATYEDPTHPGAIRIWMPCQDCHELYLTKGQSLIFFCITAENNLTVLNINTDNNITLRTKEWYIGYAIDVTQDASISWMNLAFKSKNELYEFLAKQKNITIPQTDIKKKSIIEPKQEKIKNDKSGNSIRYKQNVENYETYFAHLQNKIKTSGTNVNRNSATTNDITLTFANPQTTGTSPRYFEFDVLAQANNNTTYFDNCLMRVQYNTLAFGDSVVANNKVTITKGTSFNSTTYIDPNTNSIDQTSNTMGIPFGTTSTLPSLTRTLLTTTNQQLIHIKIEIQNCGQNVSLDFTDQTFTPMFSFYSATAQGFNTLSYDNTYYQNPLNNILCQINVGNFNSPINAGTDDILTIVGSSFGATRGNGQVKFKNADDGGAMYIQKLNAIDYLSWSDNQIQIKGGF